eukprot:4721763-Amphidinium_carterae.1
MSVLGDFLMFCSEPQDIYATVIFHCLGSGPKRLWKAFGCNACCSLLFRQPWRVECVYAENSLEIIAKGSDGIVGRFVEGWRKNSLVLFLMKPTKASPQHHVHFHKEEPKHSIP